MRITTVLILSFIFLTGIYAQDKLRNVLPLKNGKVTYTNVIQTDSLSKDELYKRAKIWLACTYELVKLDDKDELIGRGYIYYSGGVYVWQTIKIQMKNGRYKYEITDFILKEYNVFQGSSSFIEGSIDSPRYGKGFYEYIDTSIKKLIVSLEKAMKTPIDDNW